MYIAGRSAAKAQRALAAIRSAHPSSTGRLAFLALDLADLASIPPAVAAFTAAEPRLDVLVNNAGVMFPPRGSVCTTTAGGQAIELQIGTNCLGHFLLHRLLQPRLAETARHAPTASVRVLWAASLAAQLGWMALEEDGRPRVLGPQLDYAQSKIGNVFFARQFAKMTPATGVVHAAFNPGNLASELQRHWSGIDAWVTVSLSEEGVCVNAAGRISMLT